ncbi:MAG: hypothetical protein DYG92_14470 [Leptolyngbya sp. PLA1]|nr:hypothetical protein [Leptolyngbya sp. PLA1]
MDCAVLAHGQRRGSGGISGQRIRGGEAITVTFPGGPGTGVAPWAFVVYVRLSGQGEQMSSERYQRVTSILRRARGLSDAARRELLDAECDGDQALRAEVERLLASQESATIPGDAAAPGRARASEMVAPARGRTLGRYTILEVLGEGGMGVVYLAEQQRPHRAIALKVIRPGLLTPRMLRRFEHESQILGRLQHPGIAQVYEADTADSGSGPQPFFAMELVRGLPLTEYAGSKALTVEERVAMLIRVCEAVHHAHVKGVVHRDLKPGNILVTADGQPKVLDFGVARATDSDIQCSTLQTDAGQLVGTVPYMSPEQISGGEDVDARSDVYTLGVILYELLAGRLPHAVSDKTIPEAIRIIGTEDAAPLTAADRSLKGDLATIVGKALEKDRARRYQSAWELGEDLGRYLRHEPIAARPPSAAYQLRKFARRNRALVGGVAAGLVLLVGGVVGVAWQAARAAKAAQIATQEAEISREVSEFLDSMLRAVSPDEAQGREPTLHELIDTASAGLDARRGMHPRVEMALRDTLGHTYHALARYEEAQKQYEAVLALANATFGGQDPQTLRASRNVIGVLADRGKYDEAEPRARQVIDDCATHLGPRNAETIFARMDLARILQETGRWGEALPMLEEAVREGREAVGETDQRYITALHNMGSAIKDSGRSSDAVKYLREALRLRRATLGDAHPDTLYSLNNLGAALQRSTEQADRDEAKGLLQEAVDARTRVLGPDHVATITSVSNLAVVLVEQGRQAEAVPMAERVLEGWTRLLGKEHPKTLVAMGNLAYMYEDLGRLDEAEKLYRVSLDVRRKASGGRDPETWAPMNNLAMLLQKRGDLDEALRTFAELLGLCSQVLPADHPFVGIFRNNYGDCLREAGRLEEAETALRESLAILEARFGAGHARVVKAHERLARLYDAKGDTAASEAERAKARPEG